MANKRTDLIQEFFVTLTTVHRLIGDDRPLLSEKYPERRKKERRQPQTELLYMLTREKEMTIKQIAAAMFITSSAATQMVESLVGQGFLERSDDPRDRRVVRVHLTPKGKNHFGKFRKDHLERINSILKNLTNDELRMIVQIRKKIMATPRS